MTSSTRENQDQSNGTEDPNMTIEFLRARLLSERSVSRAARQRADELSQRVVELEEQLKIVSLQRRKAEKATANVLAILESYGISDGSEEFDSSSDQDETINVSNSVNDVGNGDETSTSIRVTDTPVYSSSEIDSSPSTVRSLSWKSSKNSPNSFKEDKYKDYARRKFTSSAPNGSLPKRIGKSCRRIKRKEISDSEPRSLGEGPRHLKGRDSLEDPVLGTSLDQGQEADSHFCSGSVGYEDMEGALQHQEQLIGQYEAEEKAQREWEEKFKENNSCSPDSCDPGNHSDVTEERDDTKATGQPCTAPAANDPDKELKSERADICSNKEVKALKTLLSPPHIHLSIQERECSSKATDELLAPDSGFSFSRGIHHQVQPENHNHNSSSHTHFAISSSVQSVDKQKNISSGHGCEVAPVTHETTNSIGSVLEALQQAKSSLKQKFDALLLAESRSSGTGIESFIRATRTPDILEIPAGCPGLFRLPIDMQFRTTSKANFLGSTASQLSLASYFPDNTGDKSYSSLYLEPKTSISAHEQFRAIATSSAESVIGAHMNSAYEPAIAAGLPSSARFTHLDLQAINNIPSFSNLTYPSYPFHPDITSQLPFSGGYATSVGNNDVGVHSASHLSLHDDPKFLLPRQTHLSIHDDQEVGLPPLGQLSVYDHIKPNLYR